MKPISCPAKEKKIRQEKQKKRGGEERKRKENVKSAVSLLTPTAVSKFCFLHMPELRKLIFCIWIRRLPNAWPVNSVLVCFSSLYQDSDQKMTQLQSQSKLLGHFAVFLPSQSWCTFSEVTAINNIGKVRRRARSKNTALRGSVPTTFVWDCSIKTWFSGKFAGANRLRSWR